MTKVDYTLSGCANGHPVRIEGTGTVGRSGVKLRLRATEASLTFDAGLAHLVAADSLAAIAGQLVVATDSPVVARCRADLLAEGGAEVGTIVAVAVVERRRGGLSCRAQLVEAQVAAEVGEQVATLSERTVTAAQVGGDAVLMSAVAVCTSRGREWTAICSTQLVATGVVTGASITIPPVSVSRTGK